MCEHGLVLLGQQAVISNPTVARVRVKGKFSSEGGETLSRGKVAKPLHLSTKDNDGRVSGGESDRTALVKKLGPSASPSYDTTPSTTCRIAKSIRLTGERRVKRRSSSYCPSSSSTNGQQATASTNGHLGNSKAVTLRPVYHQKGGQGQGHTSRSQSPYAGSKRHNRCLSAGSILQIHSKNSKANAWIPGGGRQGITGNNNNSSSSGRSRRNSIRGGVSVSVPDSGGSGSPVGSHLSFSQRTFHSQVDVLMRETRGRDNSNNNQNTPEKRRLRRLSHSQQLQEAQQEQKRISTAEKKARQARIEEMILVQQQKAILRVEERRKHAVAQRQRAVADEHDRRYKARERYRLREAEQERRRTQIYALNSIMRQVEERCFETFKETMERKNSVSAVTDSDEDMMTDCDSECENNSDESGDTTINLACKI